MAKNVDKGTPELSLRSILDAMQKQSEHFSQQMNNITKRLEDTQRASNEENRKRAMEIETLGRALSRLRTEGDVSSADFGSLITDDLAYTTRQGAAAKRPAEPPVNNAPQNPSYHTEPRLKAIDALRCIPTLNGEDDVGVEDFIMEVREMRAMCSEQNLLLKMIKIEKITGKAGMAIRNISINEYGQLYEALRRKVATQASVREQQDQLRDVRQGLSESVQSYIIRFRRGFNKFQYSVTNEYTDELTRCAMNDRVLKDSVTDFIRGLRTEVGQVLLANPPYNIVEAEKKAADVERYFREDNRQRRQNVRPNFRPMENTKPRPPTQSARPNGYGNQSAPPRTSFQYAEFTPLAARAQIKCFKCNKIGHTANQCGNFRVIGQQQRGPPINHVQTMEEQEPSPSTKELELIAPLETYQPFYYEVREDTTDDSSWIPEPELTFSNEDLQ